MDRSDVSVTVPGDVCAPKGFLAAGVHCGIKRERPDLAILLSERPETTAAAVFTTNHVRAAPVDYCAEVLGGGRARAVVVNSGNANACTGARGMEDTREMASVAAAALHLESAEVLVASTGVIGEFLPMEVIRSGIGKAAKALGPSGESASEAILTTDRYPKTASATFEVDGVPVTVGGMAKGAGMIHPRMATTLGFLTTDARVRADVLRSCLRDAMDRTFNRITVDGDTSTNDTVILLANGASDAPEIEGGEALERFGAAVTAVAERLAQMVPRDGEGAERLVQVRVEGAAREEDALGVAERVANSLLVKTALRGADPNWGRIMAAVGSAGVPVDESRIDLWFGGERVVEGGLGVASALEASRAHLEGDTVLIRIVLGAGDAAVSVWTCDIGEEYIHINTQYDWMPQG